MEINRIKAIKEIMNQNDISQTAMSGMLGIAESTFSRWLNNDLTNPKNQNEKVDDFLDKIAKRQVTQSAGDIPFVNTSISDRIFDILEYCRTQKIIGCVYGDAGIGKTVTVKEWVMDSEE